MAGGPEEPALAKTLQSLAQASEPDADHFIQPGFYFFQLDQFDEAVAILARTPALPGHPMLLLSLWQCP